MDKPGKLIVLPCVITEDPSGKDHLPIGLDHYIKTIDFYIVENLRTARRFIKKIVSEKEIDNITFYEINKHEYNADYGNFLKHTKEGIDIGLLSESGTASVGDPGFWVTSQAQDLNIDVVPLAGPSSILQALSASGLNGQTFSFLGYLPVEEKEKINKLKKIELSSTKSTQIFIEAPYRNNKLIETIINNCHNQTKLCIASNISSQSEFIKTKKIGDWKKAKTPNCHKIPTIFLIGI